MIKSNLELQDQSLKKERDDLTKQVKEFKQREKFNTTVKEKAEERKEVSQKKKEGT